MLRNVLSDWIRHAVGIALPVQLRYLVMCYMCYNTVWSDYARYTRTTTLANVVICIS